MLNMKSRLFSLLVASTLAVLGIAGPALAEDAFPALTVSEEREMRSNMTSLGIDGPTQERLIDKVEAGVLPDSLNPNAQPVETILVDTVGEEGQIAVYADGSRSKATVEKASSAEVRASGGSISKCKVKTFSGGSNYSDCLVKVSHLLYVGQFNASYTLANGGNSYISSAYNWACAGFGCTIESTGIRKKSADLNGPAKAEMRVRISGGPVATTGYVQLFVKGAKAWTN